MRGEDRGAGKQQPQVRGALRLPGMRAERVDPLGERCVCPEQRLDRHRARDVDALQEDLQVCLGEAVVGEHPVGAVQKRQALFRLRVRPGLCPPLRGGTGSGAASVDSGRRLAAARRREPTRSR